MTVRTREAVTPDVKASHNKASSSGSKDTLAHNIGTNSTYCRVNQNQPDLATVSVYGSPIQTPWWSFQWYLASTAWWLPNLAAFFWISCGPSFASRCCNAVNSQGPIPLCFWVPCSSGDMAANHVIANISISSVGFSAYLSLPGYRALVVFLPFCSCLAYV